MCDKSQKFTHANTPREIIFKRWKCHAIYGKYGNGRTAIELIGAGSGEPIAVATVNLPQQPLKQTEVFIKEYSENEGMTQALFDADIITHPMESFEITFPGTKVTKATLNIDIEVEKEILRKHHEKLESA